MIEEIEELKSKIFELERKYYFVKDYKLIATLLDKLHLESMILSIDEIEKNESIYLASRYEDGTVKIFKDHNENQEV